jgi:SAM-dependent methyltransferase
MASFSFDVFSGDMIRALCSGAKLVLCPREWLLETEKLYKLMLVEKIDSADFVPGVFRNLVHYLERTKQNLHFMRLLVIGSDSLYVKEYEKFKRLCSPDTRLTNSYGVTEATIDSTYFESTKVNLPIDGTVPIGRPFTNTQIYILDRNLQPVPIGVEGELHIGGVGLARGYLNRPDLNEQKFIPNPFQRGGGSGEQGSRRAGREAKGDQASYSERLYKTGDLGRYLADGNIELLSRIDNQVKIRGFRIELGEIEAVLSPHPLVQESVVIAKENISAEKYLVAYLVPNIQGETLSEQVKQWENEQVTNWQKVYQESDIPATSTDLTFNITGWDNSYTGKPIPASEMREWVNNTVDRILALSPGRVLEIGCGTGLLLCRIAPHCQEYWGIGYSQPALQYVEQIKQVVPGLERVKLLYKLADDFEGILNHQFDTVIINSVVQYFPSADYFLRVLKGAMTAIGDRGTIFIGDVRSLPLLDAYHALVQLSRASKELTVEQWQQKVHQSVSAEEQLVIAPAFFLALQQHFPQITQIEFQLKRGHYHNELTQFRYDVTLHLGKSALTTAISWLDWQLDDLTLAKVHQRLLQEQPEMLGIRHIPNSRVQHAVQLREWLQNPPAAKTVGQMQQQLMQLPATGVEPEQFWELSKQVAYTMHVSWWDANQDGCYDVVFSRSEETKPN